MTYVFYDFETSGRSSRFDQILQAGFVIYDKKILENSINLMLNPNKF